MGGCGSKNARQTLGQVHSQQFLRKKSIASEVVLVDEEKHGRYKPRSRRHLVVDDDANNRKTLVTYLKLLKIDTDECCDGEEVIALGTDRLSTYDVIWMDIRMQKMDGITCSSKLREQGYLNCIIAITGDATDATLKRCLQAGVDLLMRKPIFIESLRKLPVLSS